MRPGFVPTMTLVGRPHANLCTGLLRLGLGHDLTYVLPGGGKYLVAPPDEVLRLKPKLQTAI